MVAWIERHVDDPVDLGQGASAERLAELERQIGRPLPAELRAWLELRDGDADPVDGFVQFLSAGMIGAEMTTARELMDAGLSVYVETAGPVRPDAWTRLVSIRRPRRPRARRAAARDRASAGAGDRAPGRRLPLT